MRSFLSIVMFLLFSVHLSGKDYFVTGKVTDPSGLGVRDATIMMSTGSIKYAAVTGSDGSYVLRISGIYSQISGLLEMGTPFPNPFASSINIPFIINKSGDIRFSVYSLSGQKIRDIFYSNITAGSYRLIWDGCNDNGTPVRQGLYIYALTFGGQTWSGRLIRIAGFSAFSSASMLEPVMTPPVQPPSSGLIRIPVITTVSCRSYYPVRLTDIVISRDTVIDFEISPGQLIPFKTQDNHIAMYTQSGYQSLILKGINLGSSPPGTFPGEIAYAITGAMYEKWINMIAAAGFNTIRVYTLHPPVFYEKLSNYNNRHPENPLLLFQGIWLGEIENGDDPSEYDLTLRIAAFRSEIQEVTDCLHGNKNISFRLGRAYGNYITDISRWTAGYIIGREISPQEVDSTNYFHPSLNSYSGNQFSITGASASEVFATRMLDETVQYESHNYSVWRPVSISSWPTLDPLSHPTETYTDEDKASIDIIKITGRNSMAGLFATYHAYPYYPNFISDQPSYRLFSDSKGPDSYLGYITDLRNHYSDIPLVIGEFGVPSSWGSAHQSYSNMNHGGYSEVQQGETDLRMMHNIIDADCAGGFMFSWMDEWFKPTWIVGYLEAYGFDSDGTIVPTRQLWLNLTSPEQNFGLIGFEQDEMLPFVTYSVNNTTGPLQKTEATNDNSFFYVNLDFKQDLSGGDTVMVAFDTYSSDTGESQLPNGKLLTNRSEFLLSMVIGNDTALHHVTQAYDMNGLTPRFNLSDPLVQKYRSTVSDGAPWKIMQWINDGHTLMKQDIGRLPMEHSGDFTTGQRSAVAWNGNTMKIRIPWTLLYFYDPTRMQVIDGAVSNNGGRSFNIQTVTSDGIALSVYYNGAVISTTNRYNWNSWLVVPSTTFREKKSLQIMEAGLTALPGFAN